MQTFSTNVIYLLSKSSRPSIKFIRLYLQRKLINYV